MSSTGSTAQVLPGRRASDRTATALELGAVDSAAAVGALTDALADPSVEVRASAALALANLRHPASIAALAGIVANWTSPGQSRCRRAALRALTAFRSDEAGVQLAHALVAAGLSGPISLEERSSLLAVVYAEPTGTAAPRVVHSLISLLSHEDGATADRAAVLLKLFPTEIRGPLARTLRSARSAEARRRAAASLRACRHDESVSALVFALRDPAAAVRATAARSLGEMRDPVVVSALHAATGDADEGVRAAASRALAALGAAATATDLAADPPPLVRCIS